MEVGEDHWEVLFSEDHFDDSWKVKQEFLPVSSFRMSSLASASQWSQGAFHLGHVPQRLTLSGRQGRNNTLNGTYSLYPGQQGRPCYRKDDKGFTKFLYFWPDTGHWYIGPDLNDKRCLSKAGPGEWAALSPDRVTHKWEVVRNGKFEIDPHIKVAPSRKPAPRQDSLIAAEHSLNRGERSLPEMEAIVKKIIAKDSRIERRRVASPTVRAQLKHF